MKRSSAYDEQAVEREWQRRWEEEGAFRAPDRPEGEGFFCLEMLPYPSGALHMGHVRNYSIGDAVARFERMRGRSVMHVVGWDAMGLPAENAALKNGVPPSRWTRENIATMREQMKRIGFSYDWTREIATCEPEYYRWNQWFFLEMLEKGLVYRTRRAQNWCPRCNTVLANEQVTGQGTCWRHEDVPVTTVELDQWFIRTTEYADRLLDGLTELEEGWPERVLTMQRNWIGKSRGCRFRFAVENRPDLEVEVYSTRVDTVYGCSALLLAPAHSMGDEVTREDRRGDVDSFRAEEARSRGGVDEEREKRGVFTGSYAINPFSGEKVPIWLANFVLEGFGTGAVFAQAAHDERDFDFATEYGLPIVPVIGPPEGGEAEVSFDAEGVLFDSGPFSGMKTDEARAVMTAHAEEKGFGAAETQYRLNDWGVSRQRYWGTPIPIVHCESCGAVPVPRDELPVVLPEIGDWKGTTGSPLATAEEWVRVPCPRCGGEARRETDTMDTFVDSSWYFFRYLDPGNEQRPFDRESADAWLPVDLYIGGVEHAVGHLIYCRFWTMVMHDLGLVEVEEPAQRLFTQGMVNAPTYRCPNHEFIRPDDVDRAGGGTRCPTCGSGLDVRVEKMSKSKLNSSSPDELVERYGSDAMRLFSLFGGPPVKDLEWSDKGIEGTYRFVHRIARLYEKLEKVAGARERLGTGGDDVAARLRRRTHSSIERVTRDVQGDLQLNTAIAALMELVNDLYRVLDETDEGRSLDPESPLAAAADEALDVLARLLAPFAPHLAEEMHARRGGTDFVCRAAWPVHDPALLVEDRITLPVQINGKKRGEIEVPRGASQEAVVEAAREEALIAKYLDGGDLKRVILVPNRLLNLVIK